MPAKPTIPIEVRLLTEREELARQLEEALAGSKARVTIEANGRTAAAAWTRRHSGPIIVDKSAPDAEALLSPLLADADARQLALITGLDGRGGAVRVEHFDPMRPVDLLNALEHTLAERDDEIASQLLGESENMRLVRDQIGSLARFPDVSVLILGETGTGKELVARALHDSSRSAEPFVAINCAAIPESLFESELFGHEAGSFTGARGARSGLLETAGRGTLFLDEVGEMPSNMQPKLLRALENREFRKVGGSRMVPLEARVVSATNRSPGWAADSTLRLDLHFRLAGFTIKLAPLRERVEDCALLARAFAAAFAERQRIAPWELTPDALDVLRGHDWPGNVRELRAVVEHACIVSSGGRVVAGHVHEALETPAGKRGSVAPPAAGVSGLRPALSGARTDPSALLSTGSLPDIERELILAAWQDSECNLSKASRVLGIPRSTLRGKLRKYGAI